MAAKTKKKAREDYTPLTTFLYLLMRDELPTGTVVGILNDAVENHAPKLVYSNKELAAMARRYAERLTAPKAKKAR